MFKSISQEIIKKKEMVLLKEGNYRITTIIPFVGGPSKNVYDTNQEGLNTFLEHYGNYVEFIVKKEKNLIKEKKL